MKIIEHNGYLEKLKEQFNGRLGLREKRPGIQKLLLPLYHEDGDMIDIFLEEGGNGDKIRICDHGLTLMRLSYTFELDTPNKEKIFQRILVENHLREEKGNIFMEVNPEQLYPAVMQFAQAVAKISNMRLYKREVIKSLFHEMLAEYIEEKLYKYNPRANFFPLPQRDDLEVDYLFDIKPSPVFLFGVNSDDKARLTTIACQAFQLNKLKFKSHIVHEDFEELSRKDIIRITSAADKQFPSLEDYKEHAEEVLEREAG